MKLLGKDWSRGDRFALFGSLITAITCIAALLVVPEFRRAVGLESSRLSAQGNAPERQQSPQSHPAQPQQLAQSRNAVRPTEKTQQWQGDVDPTRPWQAIGIKAKLGDTVHIVAFGTVVHDPHLPAVGPKGTDYTPRALAPPDSDGNRFPFADAGLGALLMKVGDEIYPVGDKAEITIKENGEMQLMVNDRYGWLWDNTGSFHVRLSIHRFD
jgi:hypothetical protein